MGVSVLGNLPQIGADGYLHQIAEATQDTVFIQRSDGFELLLDFGEEGRLCPGWAADPRPIPDFETCTYQGGPKTNTWSCW